MRDIKDLADQAMRPTHPPGGIAYLLILPVVGQCGMQMVDGTGSDSVASD